MGPLKMRQPVQETGSLQDLPNPNRIEADKRLKWRANSSNVLILIVIISSAIGGRQIDCHQLPVEVGPQRLDQAQPQLAQNLFSYSYLGDNQSGNGQAAGSLRDSDEEDTREEIRDGGEVDFKLMNAAQDKLLAMKSLLNSTRQQQLIASSPEDPNHGRLATGKCQAAFTNCGNRTRVSTRSLTQIESYNK